MAIPSPTQERAITDSLGSKAASIIVSMVCGRSNRVNLRVSEVVTEVVPGHKFSFASPVTHVRSPPRHLMYRGRGLRKTASTDH